jgi:hypothetical protein
MGTDATLNSTFKGFLKAVGKHWVTLMGGGIGVVALGLFERFSGKIIPLWAYISILVFFVFVASYLAWRDERAINIEAAQALKQSLPKITIEIAEVIITPMVGGFAKCFIRVTLRNSTEEAPCMIDNCSVKLKIGGQYYVGNTPLTADAFQLATYAQLSHQREVPLNQPYHYEDGLPVIEVSREGMADIRSIIDEGRPLRRGFPKSGWLGFFLGGLPPWPTKMECGETHFEDDPETGEQVPVTDTTAICKTNTVEEVSLELIDGHGQRHQEAKSPPFTVWGREVLSRSSELDSVPLSEL